MANVQMLNRVVIRFAGDSGDGMQLTGDRFTAEAASFGNDISTLPNFPAEIRAPQGTIPGVSSFQLHFANFDIMTPGDTADVLVAMNPAALKANLDQVKRGGLIIVDTAEFTKRNLTKVGYEANPLEDGSLEDYQLHALDLTGMTVAAVKDFGLSRKDSSRAKNMFALGLLTWLYNRDTESTLKFLGEKFAGKPQVRDANMTAFRTGYAFGETTETFGVTYQVAPAPMPAGTYRQISGNVALSYGLVVAAQKAGIPLFFGAYPITPASDILHTLSRLKRFNVMTFQAEDEIAAAGSVLGASFAGVLGVTASSGPGIALKSETISLGVMTELPMVIVDVQRAGPSTGMPTKTEQSDLLMALHGRHGEAPIPVIAAQSPSDCFDAAIEATRVAIEYRTPVMLLTDGYLANGAEPWKVPQLGEIAEIDPNFATGPNGENGKFLPYQRDEETLARPWAAPGTRGLEHRLGGIEKDSLTGNISYSPANHDLMTRTRQEKVDRVGRIIPPVEVWDPGREDGEGARVLVLGWGSTYGPALATVRRMRKAGVKAAHAHLRWVNPFPANLGEVLRSYDRVVVPEMNLGQLALLLRAKYLVDVQSYSRVRGLPISVDEFETDLTAIVREVEAAAGARTSEAQGAQQ